MRKTLTVPAIILVIWGISQTATGEALKTSRGVPCEGGGITVHPNDDNTVHVCEAALAATALLGRCGIFPKQPIHIAIQKTIISPQGNVVFGLFDQAADTARITAPSNLAKLASDTPYSALPPAAFFKSIVVHEVVHVIMSHRYLRKPSSRALYEYPAYAIQLEFLSTELQGERQPVNVLDQNLEAEAMNDIILGFNPFLFARRAHNHFMSGLGQCDALKKVLEDRAEFITSLPF